MTPDSDHPETSPPPCSPDPAPACPDMTGMTDGGAFPSADSADDSIGLLENDQIIDGRYRILGLVGAGGFGRVYRAEDLNPVWEDELPAGQRAKRALVAIKLPKRWFAIREKDREKYRNEAQILFALRHPNIVRVLEYGQLGEVPFGMVSLYIEGQSLADRIATRVPITDRQAAEWAAAVAEALQHAHSQRVLHLDIKPSNLLLDGAGKLYVADFGLALRDYERAERIGKISGTPPYMSPEQADGKGLNARSDIFSLGATLYEMLTGQRPFTGESDFAILKNVRNLEPLPPRQVAPDVDEKLEGICLKALSKDPAYRYASAKEMASELRGFLREKAVAFALPPTPAVQLQHSPVLSYLADRRKQDLALRSALRDHKHSSPLRPLVILVHGPSNQLIHEYIYRVRKSTLPQILKHLGRPETPKWLEMQWDQFDNGREKANLAEPEFRVDIEIELEEPYGSWPGAATRVLANLRRPLVFCYRRKWHPPNPRFEIMLEDWVQVWREAPDLPAFPLLAFFVAEDNELTARRPRANEQGEPPETKIRKRLKEITQLSGPDVSVSLLPALGNVTMGDIDDWIRQRLQPEAPEDVCRQAREILDDPALDGEGVPFDRILDALRKLIRRHPPRSTPRSPGI